MDDKQAKALRAAFPASAIGKLPRVWCKACRDSQRKRCDDHRWVSKCSECGNSHTDATLHLDYVGHAATSDRLLSVDPEWSWEPMATDPAGLPILDNGGNLWIRLTVCGVTRIGVGDGKSAKECIGDAIRNAAMRFGVALDLWAKEDLHEISNSKGAPVGEQSWARTPAPNAADDPWAEKLDQASTAEPAAAITPAQVKKIGTAMSALGLTNREAALDYVAKVIGHTVASRNDLTKAEAHSVIDALEKEGVSA